jgi:hypothetical protein
MAGGEQAVVRQTVLIVAFLLVMAMVMAVPVLAHLSKGWSDCHGTAVTFPGPHGEPLECVCFSRSLATCFGQGP